ncbi:MAG: amidohydrolase family protein [Hyphomicrobiaceae bacterium]|jgi:predicted TIM-barrel fold metal-dependent hydrolase
MSTIERGVSGWDCHAHVFGPYDRFPLAPERSYTPPEAPLEQYLVMLKRLGLSRGVLVHPSAYSDDYSLLLNVLAAQPQLRGVIVTRDSSVAALKDVRARGVRAARFSHRAGAGTNFSGSATFDDLLRMKGTLADAGLHAELWTDCKMLPAIAAELRRLPFPVVVDHMGGFDPAAGVDDEGFRTLLSLLQGGHVWVKLCVYRNTLKAASIGAGQPFHQKMIEVNPSQLVWGSDWPHLNVEPQPDPAVLLQTFKDWTPDETFVRHILIDNPARLYA